MPDWLSFMSSDPVSMATLLTHAEIGFIIGFFVSLLYSKVCCSEAGTSQPGHLCKLWHRQIKAAVTLPLLLHKVELLSNF
jgi:hypothetical protein